MWRIAPDHTVPLDVPVLLGILNVTPDSFSDGGEYPDSDAAIKGGFQRLEDGADIIDVGGESTRPGAERVSASAQIDRVRDVVARLAGSGAVVSIDTTLAEVASVALDAGASIVNDVSGGGEDRELMPLVAARGCGLVLMHRRSPPDVDRYSTDYDAEPEYGGDVVSAIRGALADLRDRAVAAGVAPDAIVLDPGLGFGKTVSQNFTLMARMNELAPPGTPLLSAASRKSFLGAAAELPSPGDRDRATIAVSVAHAFAGIRLFRVHDVPGHRAALKVAARLIAATRRENASSTMTALLTPTSAGAEAAIVPRHNPDGLDTH